MEKINFFDKLSKIFIEPDKENNNRRFHYEIEKDKESILNFYRKEPFYKDKIDKMEMKSRGNFYYKGLVKKQIQKKSNFVRIILKSISEINERRKKIVEKKRMIGYNISQLESLRKQKKNMEIILKSRENEELKNNIFKSVDNKNIFVLNGKKSMENIYNRNNRKFSGIKKDSEHNNLTNLKNTISKSFSFNSILTNNINETSLSNEGRRIDKFNKILNKCQKEIKDGGIIAGKMERFTKRFNKKLSIIKTRRENKVDNNIQDQKIVEDKIKPRQKYKLLEIEKFKELKRRLNAKISDNYVYFNRKEYSELVNDRRKNGEYDLYYEDVNKINEKILQNRIKEKNKFIEIKDLLEDSYKKKDYLKNKILDYKNKRISIANKKRENKVDNNIEDQKIVEDKISPKQKYKLLEIEKFKELKRKLNSKLSINYAFFNRKEYSELVNEKKNEEEYDLYYEDMNKINEKILQNREKEKTKFIVIKDLLEDSYKKKDYLKNKISIYNNKMVQFEKESKEKKFLELFIREEGKKRDTLGTLVPRILLKKKENIDYKKRENI